MASGRVLLPVPEVYTVLYKGRAAGFEPELVKLAALPHCPKRACENFFFRTYSYIPVCTYIHEHKSIG
jgi:hypothetical protein